MYQHGGPEVELLSQLGDVDVHGHQVLVVILLHLPDDVSQPLELPLGPCHPDEVDLGTGLELRAQLSSGSLYPRDLHTNRTLLASLCPSPDILGNGVYGATGPDWSRTWSCPRAWRGASK